MLKRTYLQWFDSTLDIPVQVQGDDPANTRFSPIAGLNQRSVLGGDNNVWTVADSAVSPRGAKNIIWSSEGYSSLGNNLTQLPGGTNVGSQASNPINQAYNAVTIPALTAALKKATGSTGSSTLGNIGTLLGATPPVLDLSPYRNIVLVVNLISFTGGASPSFQPEFDILDDAATPLVIPLFKPTAVTAATTWIVNIGPNQPFMQAAAAPTATIAATPFPIIPTAGFTNLTSYYSIPLDFPPNGQFQWTVTGAPTAISWTTFIYGKY